MLAMKDLITPAALQLILDYECGGGRSYYEKKLARPTWPEGQSGVTIGIGYDLGYTPEARFVADWRSELRVEQIDRLRKVIGLKGARAAAAVKGLSTVVIPWHAALAVFTERTLPYWIGETVKAFPHATELPGDAFGALVSLVFNRGPSLRGKNRQDMQDIYNVLSNGVQAGDLALIAKELRDMKRIWAGKGLPGLVKRREAEAQLVEGAAR